MLRVLSPFTHPAFQQLLLCVGQLEIRLGGRHDFARIGAENPNDKFTVVGGLMGTDVLDQNAIKALATLPSLDQLRAKIIGVLQAPATKVAGVIQAPASQLARVLGAYAAKEAA